MDAREVTGRVPVAVRSDSLNAIGCGYDVVFGDNLFNICGRDVHVHNRQRPNNRHERFHSTARVATWKEGVPD